MLCLVLYEVGIDVFGCYFWNYWQKCWLCVYFCNEIMLVLLLLGLDLLYLFLKIFNKLLNIVVVFKGIDVFGCVGYLVIVCVLCLLLCIIQLLEKFGGGQIYVFLFLVLFIFVDELFLGMEVQGVYQFCVICNFELVVDEEEVENLVLVLCDELVDCGYWFVVWLEIVQDCLCDIVCILLQNFGLIENVVYCIDGLVNFNCVVQLYDLLICLDLKYLLMSLCMLCDSDGIFEVVVCRDVLLYYLFDVFMVVLDLIKQVVIDFNVLVIKQMLYCIGKDLLIVDVLIQVVCNGKDVMVVVELCVCFDEEVNFGLVDCLQEVGVQVVYGVVGYKIYVKMLLIVCCEGCKLCCYVYLGIGNYYSGIVCVYIDLSLIIVDVDIGNDVYLLFQQLFGLVLWMKFKCLLQFFFILYIGVLQWIECEIWLVVSGCLGWIIVKMNVLNEFQVVWVLYVVLQVGVQIDLIVCGVCMLCFGVLGVLDNIWVCLIVGCFLEYSWVYWFGNDGVVELYCVSVDWLECNLLCWVEICFLILDLELVCKVYCDVLQNYLDDNFNVWELYVDGNYYKCVLVYDELLYLVQMVLMQGL